MQSYRAHTYKGAKLGLMLCCCHLETQYISNGAPHFHFALPNKSRIWYLLV